MQGNIIVLRVPSMFSVRLIQRSEIGEILPIYWFYTSPCFIPECVLELQIPFIVSGVIMLHIPFIDSGGYHI